MKSVWLAAVLLTTPALAQPIEDEAGVIVTWRSNNQTRHDLATSVERLYVILQNTGNLPVREVTVPTAQDVTVQTVLRNEGAFFGAFFPVAVDALLCDLNPKVCSREKQPVTSGEISALSVHVNGTKPSSGKWTHRTGDRLTIPALSFDNYIETATGKNPRRAGVELGEIVAGVRENCGARQQECERLLRRLNPAVFDPHRSTAVLQPETIHLPALGVETRLALFGIGDTESSAITTGLPQITKAEWLEASHEGVRLDALTTPSAEASLEALSNNVVSYGTASEQSAGTSRVSSTRLAELVSHPINNFAAWPPHLKHPVRVAIFDGRLDVDHCALKGVVTLDNSLGAFESALERPRSSKCGEELQLIATASADHGTHVAGLIAADPTASAGLSGINPYARIVYVPFDKDRMGDSDYQKRLGDRIRQLAEDDSEEPVRVVNLSWAYDTINGNDAIYKNLLKLDQVALVTVAAESGNDARQAICDGYPACFDSKLKNVITVVGLDQADSPSLWRVDAAMGSDWSADFGIAAVAADVVSTAYGGYSTSMSGTSQAAPQVAAAASLIYSAFMTHYAPAGYVLEPIRVKNRLIYTADITPSLLDKVKGGRLNVRRAVALSTAHLDYMSTQGERRSLDGEFMDRFPGFEGAPHIICGTSDGAAETTISFGQLRRMHFNEATSSYVVFYNESAVNRDSKLLRLVDCDLRTHSNRAVFLARSSGGQTKQHSLNFYQILDYTSGMY